MRGMAQDALNREKKRREFLETGFRLFSEKNIETVSLPQIAEAAGYGTATLYRYFDKKPGFVVAVATWMWEQFYEEYKKRKPKAGYEGRTAAEIFEFYLDSFLVLYRDHRDLLRFNQFFNVYVQSEKMDAEMISPYQGMINVLETHFHNIYAKAQQDHTLRTDMPEIEMFSATLHLMLAAVTRYAVGLVYIPYSGFNAEKELELLKTMILNKYRTKK